MTGGAAIRPVLGVLFLVSCTGMTPVAAWLTESMTVRPLHPYDSARFPVALVFEDDARIRWLGKPNEPPGPPPENASFLVPEGKAAEVVRHLRGHEDPKMDGGWMLEVKPLSAERQRIELYWMADGYRGGIYEATATTVTPLFRKVTGPGYAFVLGPVALALNGALWGAAHLAWRWYRRRRAARPALADNVQS